MNFCSCSHPAPLNSRKKPLVTSESWTYARYARGRSREWYQYSTLFPLLPADLGTKQRHPTTHPFSLSQNDGPLWPRRPSFASAVIFAKFNLQMCTVFSLAVGALTLNRQMRHDDTPTKLIGCFMSTLSASFKSSVCFLLDSSVTLIG